MSEEITRRDYFAAHAPQCGAPEWFRKKVEESMPPMPEYRCENTKPYDDWHAKYNRELEATWPWAWADIVLSRREK